MHIIEKIKNYDVIIDAPPSKAHTLRALIIGGLASGITKIYKPLFAQDQQNVIACLRGLGVDIAVKDKEIAITGSGGHFKPTGQEINVGESGVGMNFLTSAACLSEKPVIITGAKRITERPVGEVVSGLIQLGANVEYIAKEGFLPVKVYGGGIKGGVAKINGSQTSQYFSSLVISSPYADKDVELYCLDEMTEKPYFDISVKLMEDFGVKATNENYKHIHIPNSNKYTAREITIEGDYSSASFFFLAAAVCGAKITISNLRQDTAQGDSGFVTLLEKMGCKVSHNDSEISLEGRKMTQIEQDMGDMPDLVPPIAVAAAFAKGTSRFTNIGHLRHKESDRLSVVALELQKMGVNAYYDDTSLMVDGTEKIKAAKIDTHNDHRIAMSFAAAGLAVGGQIIEKPACVAKSFPDFWEKFAIFTK
jgi:3-phosphoshikimate 1-carboxyvinyltransferase